MLLRALDPHTELELFHESYNWRTSPKRNTRTQRMTFEDFASDYPNKVVMGLFHVEHLVAVYVIIEIEPRKYEFHYTCRRDVLRGDIIAGGKVLIDWLKNNNAKEIGAWIVSRNRPLAAVALECGFQKVDTQAVVVDGTEFSIDHFLVPLGGVSS